MTPTDIAELLERLAVDVEMMFPSGQRGDAKEARAIAVALRGMKPGTWRCIKTRTGVESKQHESPRSLKYCEDHWTSQTHIPLFELPDLPEKEVPK